MTPEQRFKKWLTSNAPASWHIQCIESTTGRGIPDINLCAEGFEAWLELKAGGPVPLIRPEQLAWISRRMAAGGRAYVLHRRDDGNWGLYGPPFTDLSPRADRLLAARDNPLWVGSSIGDLAKAITSHHL